MNTPLIAALNTGPDFHLLDHIAPLSEVLRVPLIVTEEKNHQLAKTYYPHVTVEYQENLDFRLDELAARFDALIECKYWAPHLKPLFQQLYGKKIDLIFCPHGQSDKGFATPLLAPYAEQDIVLLYGNLLIEMLQTLETWPAITRFVKVGDFRSLHYRRYQNFYDALADKEIFSHLPRHRPTFLYAPTWQDADGSTSFFDQGKALYSQFPSDWNLIVKVHPLLEQRNPAHYYAALHHLEKMPNAILVDAFPPIHPILARADAYIGDFSSVGYDFLQFKRPMFFLPHPTLPAGRLHTCGQTLNLNAPFISAIEKTCLIYASKQEALYQHTFEPIQEEQIRTSLHNLLRSSAP